MILGIGNDIIEIARIAANMERYGERFLNRIYTPQEQAYCLQYKDSHTRFAGRFAAKEAIVKALGCGFTNGITWQDIWILNNPSGKPNVYFSDKLKELFNNPEILISISHCKDYATAFAIYTGSVA